MMFRMMIAAAALAVMTPTALAQAASPEAALARFVELANAGELTSAAGQAVLTGEAKQMATSAKSALPAPDRIVMAGADHAAARFVLKGAPGEEADVYFYLDRTPAGWAVSAYRNKALAAMDIALLQQMKKQPILSERDEIEKRNLELLLSTDMQLRTWFAANRKAMDDLRAAIRNEPGSSPLRTMVQLGLTASNDSTGQPFRLEIGRSGDNKVGFLFPESSGPPKISPSGFFWLEDLGGGWLLFREFAPREPPL
jgi:hypothetical protein